MRISWMLIAGLVAMVAMAQAQMVLIGGAGNTADTTGYGAVGYVYQISATAVTIAEFTDSGVGSGNENAWLRVGGRAPATRVSLYEAMKYCNWLTSGDPDKGYYSTSDGGATWQANALSHDAYAAANGMTYFLPTENEWYKAAYYNVANETYYKYAHGSDTPPPKSADGSTGWNYDNALSPSLPWTVDKGNVEQNGTYNMMGNVYELMEESVVRGGRWGYRGGLNSTSRSAVAPTVESNNNGFRVVAVSPPPR